MPAMGERDAFGREIGEDPLGAMGWGAAPAPPPRSAPAPAPPPRPAPVAAPPRRRPPRRRRRAPLLVRLLVPLMALVVAVAAGIGQVSLSVSGPDGGAVVGPTPQLAPVTSLLRPQALRAALRKLPSGRLEYLRVSAARIDAHVLGDRYHLVSVDDGGVVADVTAATAVRGPRLHVNAAAPRRAAKAAARAAHVPLSFVSYLLLRRHGWDLFLAGGTRYRSDPAGRHVHRVG
jgi:hypothetical protein